MLRAARKPQRPNVNRNKLLIKVKFCCSVYSLCVKVHCTTAPGWQPNCS